MKISKLMLILGAAAAAASAQETITVKLNGTTSICSTHVGAGTFAAQSWSFGAQNQSQNQSNSASAVQSQISAVTLIKQIDECSTALFGLVATGNRLTSATLTVTDPTGKQTLMTLLLEGAVLVSSYQLSGTAASPAPVETIAFTFTQITITYYATSIYGGTGTVTTFRFDLSTMKPF